MFDRRLGMASFQPCGFFGVSLINGPAGGVAVIARGMKSSAGQTRHWVRGFAYRSKFSDCPDGAVRNSYPKLDLPWENVIAGPWGWPPLNGASASPGPSSRHAAGRDAYHMPPGEFQIEEMQPGGTDELAMTRPNPVRRGKSRPPVLSPRRSGRVDAFGPPTPPASSEAACARAAAKPCESKCCGIQASLD